MDAYFSYISIAFFLILLSCLFISQRPRKNNIGASTWAVLHSSAGNYKDSKTFYTWLKQTIQYLSCTTCITHAEKYLRDHPTEGISPERYVFDLHNCVNRRLGKKELDWSQYRKIYTPSDCNI